MTIVLEHPLADHIITHLRDKTTKPATFRTLAYQLTLMLAIDATRDLATEAKAVETPLEPADRPRARPPADRRRRDPARRACRWCSRSSTSSPT